MTERVDLLHPLQLKANARILVLRTDRIGDVLISQPFLRLLRGRFPDGQIDVLLGRRNAAMSSFVGRYANAVLVYHKNLASLLRLIFRLRRTRYDLVIDLQDNVSRTSALLMKLSGASMRLGFEKENREVYTHVVERPDRASVHMVEVMATLMTGFGVQPSVLQLEVPGVANRELQELIAARRHHEQLDEDVFINITAGKDSMWWGRDRWIDLIVALRSQHPDLRIVVGSDAARKDDRVAIAQASGVGCADDAADLAAYALRLCRARMVITPDTSIVHLAAALKLPSVVLYAKPHPDRMPWWPYGVDYRACVAAQEGGVAQIGAKEVLDAALGLYGQVCARS